MFDGDRSGSGAGAGGVVFAPGALVPAALALIAFAANSLLTRLALGTNVIDATSFTVIRLGAGALSLSLLVRIQSGTWAPLKGGGVCGALALVAYAVPFSFAYLRIGAAVGALVLFGVVQITMIGVGMRRGERPTARAWVGLGLASGGLTILTVPSVDRPDLQGLLLMGVAGVAWAMYSLVGKGAPDPVAANARSFLWGTPVGVLIALLQRSPLAASTRGVVLALISGAVTSGLGYAVWYRALRHLTVTQAAALRLNVPVIAAAGAAVLLAETLTAHLVLSGAAVLCGVGLVMSARPRSRV